MVIPIGHFFIIVIAPVNVLVNLFQTLFLRVNPPVQDGIVGAHLAIKVLYVMRHCDESLHIL